MSSDPLSDPLAAARDYLRATPGRTWAARLSSLGAALCLALAFPLVYLAVDLLVSRGRPPAFADLTPAQQARAAEEHERLTQDSDYRDLLRNLGAPNVGPAAGTAVEWEARHRVALHRDLAERVSPEAAAEAYPLRSETLLTAPGAGVLSLVARERGRWTAQPLGVLAAYNPWAWKPILGPTANASYLAGLALAAAALVLVRGLLLNLNAYWATAATLDAGVRLRRAVYTHGQRLSAVAVRPEAQAEAGELVSTRVEEIQSGLAATLTEAVRLPVMIAVTLALFAASQPWLSVGVIALTALVWLIAGQAAAWFRRDARLARRRADSRLGMLRESVAGTQLARAYLMERFSQTRFERHLADLAKSLWRRQREDTFTRPTLFTIVVVVGLAVAYVAGRVVLAGEMSVAALVLKSALLATVVVCAARYLGARARVRRAADAAADVFEFLQRRGDVSQSVDAEFLQPLSKKLELVEVTLREPGTGRMILENVSVGVPAGSQLAVVTPDPAEGHALAFLMTRFLDPTAGEVRIDGKNTRWVTYESVRTQVAVVLEQALTFSDTVANNVGCGDPAFTLPQIIEACKLAHAHQFVQRLPYGYETRIGTAGMNLSVGERFRLALARAILRDPSLLIIEEPADGMDADSLVLIDDTLARIRAGRTIVYLATRSSTMRAADRVLVLRQGRVVASGAHADLVASSELYRLLHSKQMLAAGAV